MRVGISWNWAFAMVSFAPFFALAEDREELRIGRFKRRKFNLYQTRPHSF